MLLCILSDIHDQTANLRAVLKAVLPHQPRMFLICGDITREETLLEFESLGRPVHFCLGNCDEVHRTELQRFAQAHAEFFFHQNTGVITLEAKTRVVITHFPRTALEKAHSFKFTAVFYGHTHRRKTDRLEHADGRTCLLANPGEIQGRYGAPAAMLWDTDSSVVQTIEISA
jgi:uncharacterized protein